MSRANPSHSLLGISPIFARSTLICSVLICAEWLRGSPAIGRPQPLTVYAKTTLGRSVTASQASKVSTRLSMLCPPRSLRISKSSLSEYCLRCSATPAGAPSRKRARRSSCFWPKRDWYCSLGMSSNHCLNLSLSGSANAFLSLEPYLTSVTCQPAASNCARHCAIRIPGITRSSDWRLKSTIHITFPTPSVAGSATASQIFPSSSSASPISAIKRECGRAPKWAST